ncbi:GerMN domain-containing protein [Paenibacillus chartarius]|uniref:GerMN domain-containing protein n=1 Tax=Paenibacillus chartarius TaxID=747481 RepID=A0ABV6DJ31_9BACL
MKLSYKWIGWGAVTGAIVILSTGCSLLGSGNKLSIDPPPAGYETSANAGGQAVAVSAKPTEVKDAQQTTVYLKDSYGFIAPVTLALPKTTAVATQALQYMVDGGPVSGLLPEGFTAPLPKGTKLTMDVKDKIATVDFSKEFVDYNPQDERKMLEAITWTLTGFPEIEQVQIKVQGAVVKEMPQDGTPIDEPLSRAMGINLQKGQGVDYGRSTPVTLYFLNQENPDYHYYVPVTRLIERTDNIAKAVVDQLIQGPGESESKGLISALTSTLELKSDIKIDGDVATVNFSEKLLGEDQKAPAEALQAVVLSLTENTVASKVQIQVNGNVKFTSNDQKIYSSPVSRPDHLNPVKM